MRSKNVLETKYLLLELTHFRSDTTKVITVLLKIVLVVTVKETFEDELLGTRVESCLQ